MDDDGAGAAQGAPGGAPADGAPAPGKRKSTGPRIPPEAQAHMKACLEHEPTGSTKECLVAKQEWYEGHVKLLRDKGVAVTAEQLKKYVKNRKANVKRPKPNAGDPKDKGKGPAPHPGEARGGDDDDESGDEGDGGRSHPASDDAQAGGPAALAGGSVPPPFATPAAAAPHGAAPEPTPALAPLSHTASGPWAAPSGSFATPPPRPAPRASVGGPAAPAALPPAPGAGGGDALPPVCPPELDGNNKEGQMVHVLSLLEAVTRTKADGETLKVVHNQHGTEFKGGKKMPFTTFDEVVCMKLQELRYLSTTKIGPKKEWKYRLTEPYSSFQVGRGRAPVLPPGGWAPAPIGDAEALSAEERLRRAQAEVQLSDRRRRLAQTKQAFDAAASALGRSRLFKEALTEAKAHYEAQPRGAAASVACALMARLQEAAQLLEAAKAPGASEDQRERAAALCKPLGPAAVRPRKRASSFRVAHQNMGSCYGTNGGPKLLPGKLRHLLTLLAFYDVDVVVCTEMPDSSAQVLQQLLGGSPKWGFRVSAAVSPEEAAVAEHVVWLFNKHRVAVPGTPVAIDDWTSPSSRVPVYLDMALMEAQDSRGIELRLYGLHLRPKAADAHIDVRALGRHARGVASPERCVLAGDFNLAPRSDLDPSPVMGGTDAFAELRAAGWCAANLARTNLAALAAGDSGKVRDNFLVHRALLDPEQEHAAAMRLEDFRAAPGAPGDTAWAFVAQLDEMMLAQASAAGVPRDWLLEGLKCAASDPRDALLAMLDAAVQAGDGAASGAGAAADAAAADGGAGAAGDGGGGSRNAAARGLSQLGLFDHCFSFIDLSQVH